MREILFRGKRIDSGKMVEGFYLPIGERAYIICEAESECVDGENTDLYATEWYEVDPETVCQYTGLTDKNGRKIFEGDIAKVWCRETEWTAMVEFGNPNGKYDWGWQLVPIIKCDANTDILLWVDMEETGAFCEVIGNIFDNPELIGG